MTSIWTEEQTMDAIVKAREIFGDRRTTPEKYSAMEKVLGLAYLYCPEEMREIVWATALESTMRRGYFHAYVWAEKQA